MSIKGKHCSMEVFSNPGITILYDDRFWPIIPKLIKDIVLKKERLWNRNLPEPVSGTIYFNQKEFVPLCLDSELKRLDSSEIKNAKGQWKGRISNLKIYGIKFKIIQLTDEEFYQSFGKINNNYMVHLEVNYE